MKQQSPNISSKEHREIIEKILAYWEEFEKTEFVPQQQNPLRFFQTALRNQYVYPDFEKTAQRFLQEMQPYKEAFRDFYYMSRLAATIITTPEENHLNIPFDFLRFQAILGRKEASKLFNRLKIAVSQGKLYDLNDFLSVLTNELYEGSIPLTDTDLAILRELCQSYEEYCLLDRGMTNRSAYLAKRIRPHLSSINRSLQKMGQLGILKYNVYINYPKLGLIPYLVRYSPPFVFKMEEEKFIPLKIANFNAENFAVLLIPSEREDRLAKQISLTRLRRFETSWNFTAYESKNLVFPEALRDVQFFTKDPKDIVFPSPQGISIHYQGQQTISFQMNDLRIIHETSLGRATRTITELLAQEKGIKSHSYISQRTRFLLKENIIRPYFLLRYVGLHCLCFVFAEGESEQIGALNQLLRFMISQRHYYGQNNEGKEVLFSVIRMPPSWQHPFHRIISHFRKSTSLSTLQIGWFPWPGAFRRVYLFQLWNEEEEYWQFPYHAR
ncbi:MAG: hypothetical protein ACFFBD_14990 [Candidatus Hodarchaeota archaeon]